MEMRKWGILILGVLVVSLVYFKVDSINYHIHKLDEKLEVMETDRQFFKQEIDSLKIEMKRLHPYKERPKKWGRNICWSGTFMGYILQTPLDTNITRELEDLLISYPGPKPRISSLRRHFNCKSDHFYGRAVDWEWKEDVVEFLISPEGEQWLKENNVKMYLENNRKCHRLKRYLEHPRASKYVFVNPRATGPHIHLEV